MEVSRSALALPLTLAKGSVTSKSSMQVRVGLRTSNCVAPK